MSHHKLEGKRLSSYLLDTTLACGKVRLPNYSNAGFVKGSWEFSFRMFELRGYINEVHSIEGFCGSHVPVGCAYAVQSMCDCTINHHRVCHRHRRGSKRLGRPWCSTGNQGSWHQHPAEGPHRGDWHVHVSESVLRHISTDGHGVGLPDSDIFVGPGGDLPKHRHSRPAQAGRHLRVGHRDHQ